MPATAAPTYPPAAQPQGQARMSVPSETIPRVTEQPGATPAMALRGGGCVKDCLGVCLCCCVLEDVCCCEIDDICC